jgi:hypothetical protein
MAVSLEGFLVGPDGESDLTDRILKGAKCFPVGLSI